jgi:hypothetical protein
MTKHSTPGAHVFEERSRLRPAKTSAVAVSADSFRCAPLAKLSALTDGNETERKGNGPFRSVSIRVRHLAVTLHAELPIAPVLPRVAVLALRFAGEESEQMASRWRDSPPSGFSADPAHGVIGSQRLSRRSASRCEHKSMLCVIPPQCRIPLAREPSALSLRRFIANAFGLQRPGVLNITASCVHRRLLHCHAHCWLTPAPHCQRSARASSQASFAPTAPLRLNTNSRVCCPKAALVRRSFVRAYPNRKASAWRLKSLASSSS